MNADNRQILARAVIGFVLPVTLVAGTILPLLVFRDRLPEPVATHWGWNGPNGSMSFGFLMIFQSLFVGVPAAAMALASRRRPAYRGEIAGSVAITGFVGTMVVVATGLIVRANLDAATWTEATTAGLAGVAFALFLAAGVAIGVRSLARSIELDDTRARVVPRAGLEPGTRAVWLGTARAWWPYLIVVGFLGAGIVMAATIEPAMGFLFVLIGLSGLAFTSIRVTADRHGVRIDYGALGWPTQRIPLADIRQASAIHVVPMQRGGWGYRGSLRLFGRAAVVLRSGDGIQLDLAEGRRLVITVDGAPDGAGVINDLVAAGPGS